MPTDGPRNSFSISPWPGSLSADSWYMIHYSYFHLWDTICSYINLSMDSWPLEHKLASVDSALTMRYGPLSTSRLPCIIVHKDYILWNILESVVNTFMN